MKKAIFLLMCVLVQMQCFASMDLSLAYPLNYKMVQEVSKEEGESAKTYKLLTPSLDKDSHGVVMLLPMSSGKLKKYPVFIKKNGLIFDINEEKEFFLELSGGYGEKFEVLVVATGTKNNSSTHCLPYQKV